jgi:hypothetical protein
MSEMKDRLKGQPGLMLERARAQGFFLSDQLTESVNQGCNHMPD